MTDKPEAGAPLTAESVRLLRAGDLLRVVEAGSFLLGRGLRDGGVAVVRSIDSPYIDVHGPSERSDNRASRFTFIGRPDPDGWIAWSGGENPVPGQRVDIRWSRTHADDHGEKSNNWEWQHTPGGLNITAFRLSRPFATPEPVAADGVREAVDQDVAILAAYARRLGPRSPFAGSITRVLAALTTHGAGVGSAGDAARQVILDFDVEEYVEGYEFRGDEGAFMPNEWTRTLITDAIHGLMSELCLALAEARQRLDGTEAG